MSPWYTFHYFPGIFILVLVQTSGLSSVIQKADFCTQTDLKFALYCFVLWIDVIQVQFEGRACMVRCPGLGCTEALTVKRWGFSASWVPPYCRYSQRWEGVHKGLFLFPCSDICHSEGMHGNKRKQWVCRLHSNQHRFDNIHSTQGRLFVQCKSLTHGAGSGMSRDGAGPGLVAETHLRKELYFLCSILQIIRLKCVLFRL